MAKRYELPDAAWDLVADIFNEPRRNGRPRADDRLMLNGVLWVLCSGAAWRDMPERFGPWSITSIGKLPAKDNAQARARGLPIGRSVGKHLRILAIVARC